jgi:hypothetical protein
MLSNPRSAFAAVEPLVQRLASVIDAHRAALTGRGFGPPPGGERASGGRRASIGLSPARLNRREPRKFISLASRPPVPRFKVDFLWAGIMEARAAAGVKRQGPPGGCDRRSDNTSVSRDSSMSGKSVFAGVTNKLGPLCVELSHLARDPLTSPWRHERPFFDRRRLPSCFVKPFSKRSRRTQPIKCECSGSWMRSTTLLPVPTQRTR